MKKKLYEDFVGEKISIEINPYEFKSAEEALRAELWKRIKAELSSQNGLLCRFKEVKTTINSTIVVTGIVTQCEVDC